MNIQYNCHHCNKEINKNRKVAIGYTVMNTIDVYHWTCFVELYSNTHDNTYIGAKQYHGGVPNIVQWSELSEKDRRCAKTQMKKIKMYGDLRVHPIRISGMGGSSMMIAPSDVEKIYNDNHTSTKKMFADRKKEWLLAEKNLN